MKKVLTVLLAATGILAFSACGGNNPKEPILQPSADTTQIEAKSQAAPATQDPPTAQATDEVSIPANGVTLTLPKGFQVYKSTIPSENDNATMVVNPDETVVFCVVKDKKSRCERHGITSLDGYLAFQYENSQFDIISSIQAEQGVPNFEYDYTNDNNQTFRYFTTAKESGTAFYTLQCFAPVDAYDGNRDRIINWMRNAKVK